MSSNNSDPPVYTARHVTHKIPADSGEKVNIILKNMVGPSTSIKKVRIPINTPVSKLKEKLAEIYGLNPAEFELTHISKKEQSEHPDKGTTTVPRSKTPENKQYVRIILRDQNGIKKFQKKLRIPETTTVSQLREEVAKKFNVDPQEFNISIEKYL